MQISLEGQNVLVTGASRGIGKAIAEALAKAGARVAIHYNRNAVAAEELAARLGHGAKAYQANLANLKEVSQLFETVVADMGQVNCVVNNAGIALSSAPDKEDEAWLTDWQQTMRVNLDAVGLLCKKALQHFEQFRHGGRLINISSRAAFRGDTPDYLAYAASKGGLVALTRSIARYWGKKNITAFLVAPGFTRTDMAQDFMDQYGEEYALNDIALNSLTEPEDIAPTITFLVSGHMDHATGSTIDINAGSYVH